MRDAEDSTEEELGRQYRRVVWGGAGKMFEGGLTGVPGQYLVSELCQDPVSGLYHGPELRDIGQSGSQGVQNRSLVSSRHQVPVHSKHTIKTPDNTII